MKVSERFYAQSLSLPKVIVHKDETGDLLFVILNWGEQAHVDNLISEMTQFIHAASADVEVTHPYDLIPHLPKDVNTLRIAMMIGNDYLYRQENNHEYNAGVEILILKKSKNMMSWARLGRPSLFRYKNKEIVPILTFNSILKELPTELLGVHQKIDVQSGHFPIDQSIDLIAYCGVDWPQLDKLNNLSFEVDPVVHTLIKAQPKISGFWLAIISD